MQQSIHRKKKKTKLPRVQFYWTEEGFFLMERLKLIFSSVFVVFHCYSVLDSKLPSLFLQMQLLTWICFSFTDPCILFKEGGTLDKLEEVGRERQVNPTWVPFFLFHLMSEISRKINPFKIFNFWFLKAKPRKITIFHIGDEIPDF